MTWDEVRRHPPIFLNLGGAEFRHPLPRYQNYISVDLNPPPGEWSVRHDLTQPIPLPDASVARIHTEDFLEHLSVPHIEAVLAESHRLLAPGGFMRIGVPDYNNPKDRPWLRRGSDSRFPTHLTLTHYALMRQIVERSPFRRHRFYHYWDGDRFVHEPMDFSLGFIRRTPEHDPKCRSAGGVEGVKRAARDVAFLLARGFAVGEVEMATRKGHPLHVTSLTVDLFKDGPAA